MFLSEFTENNLGQHMLNLAKAATELAPESEAALAEGRVEGSVSRGVLEVSAAYGCWLWSQEEEPLICHLDGRKFGKFARMAQQSSA